MKKNLFDPPFLPDKVGNKYFNYDPESEGAPEAPEWFLPSIKMYLMSHLYGQKAKSDLSTWVEPYHGYEKSKEPIITWLGHATVLIQIDNLNILADPIIESPSWLYKRILPFGAEPHTLPPIDVVVLSHNHRDHMDSATLKLLHERHDPLFLVPVGDKPWFLKRSMTKVEEFSWWETWEHKGVGFTFVPAWHWSQRGLLDHNTSLWGGWVIQGGSDTVFFAGDTAYNQHYFKTIGNCFPDIEVAIMPIGPCDPDELMRRSHMSAQEAGLAFLDCKGKYFVPMHWGTFYFGVDSFDTPIERFSLWWDQNQKQLQEKFWFACKVGQQLHLEHHKNACSDKPDQNR